MLEIPAPVRKLLVPVLYRVGKLLGKHDRFADAPEPVRRVGSNPWTWSSPEATGRSLFTWSGCSCSAATAPAA